MQPEAWKRRIGAENFDWLVETLSKANEKSVQARIDGHDVSPHDQREAAVSAVMTQLYELGWRGPEKPPKLSIEGTRTLWPSADGTHMVPVLTSEGLERFWKAQGHAWLLLRVPQVCRGMGGPLAPRFQEMLAAYEEQCCADGLKVLPDWADWNVFVGGELPTVDGELLCMRLAKSESK